MKTPRLPVREAASERESCNRAVACPQLDKILSGFERIAPAFKAADWVLARGGLLGVFPEGIQGAFTPQPPRLPAGPDGRPRVRAGPLTWRTSTPAPEAADDPAVVRATGREVRRRLQQALDDLRARWRLFE